MKTYRVFGHTTITRTYVIEAESEEEAIEIVQDYINDFEDENIDEDWIAEEY